ncbi:hypothetical protein KFK09_009433 [Dendrobium nobile]|uniref:U-box domain-containing protein n=1 Tax=Dendrobium nobile TaxID=94219 RepID=A0A8T3BLD6_DENNO|nr:hypothetical protein KFK09_009433 [Dendrobium nobile]
MSRNQPKLKPPPRPFFSCGIFRNCTQSVLSPRTPPSSAAAFLQQPLPPPPPPPPLPPPTAASAPLPSVAAPSSSSSSSSSSASHSFTQWRFPLQHSHHNHQPPPPDPESNRPPSADSASTLSIDLAEAFHASELHFSAGDSLHALRLLERSLATASPSPPAPPASPGVMAGVVAALRVTATARAAAKVLLAMLLAEGNRRVAVEAGAVAAAVEAVASAGSGATTVKERTLAALELLCTVEEGAEEVREHALAPAALAGSVEEMTGRGRECGIGILAAIYGGERAAEAPSVVAHAVVVALQGECSTRGRRKGAQLLRALKERSRLDLAAVRDDC